VKPLRVTRSQSSATETRRRPGRRPRIGTAAILSLVTLSVASQVQPSSSPGSSVPAAAQRDAPGALVAPVRLIPSAGEPIDAGTGHGYWGTIELRAPGDGLVLVNRLTLERYLLGLQEVPLTWPEEALKAQAVAARTYALNTLARPRAGAAAAYGFDICATVECQVFSGADVLGSLGGARWLQAVGDTAGLAVLYRGEPILARYHSTSGGATLDNSRVFTSEPDYPYLQGVPSITERGSPLYRWRVEFSLRRLQSLLERAGWWSIRGRLERVTSVASGEGRHYPDLIFRGRKGRLVRSAEDFRAMARELAPAMWPDRYPSPWQTTSGRLPETLPSNRLTARTAGRRVVILGRGWGHGVGMSQWGAEGMARDGASLEQILEHYYRGVEIAEYDGPGRITVGLDWARSSAEMSGAFRIVDGRGRTVVRDALGTWTFSYSGTDVVAVDPPKGFGLPLRVGIVRAPSSVEPGAVARVTVALSRPSRIRALTEGESGETDAEVADAGRQEVRWHAPAEPGDYRVRVEASSGGASRRSDAVEIAVTAGPEPAPAPQTDDGASDTSDRTLVYLLVLVLVVVTLAGRWLAGRING